MKKDKILNSELSYVIAKLGHTQTIVIGDCGLPIPEHVERIDLAVVAKIPSFEQVLDAVLSEMCVEKFVLAEEIKTKNSEVNDYVMNRLTQTDMEYVSHEEFKKLTEDAICIVRTGDIRPYSNIILQSGVFF
ncbi:D-ribose pyranase [Peptoniphilus asaccharolyticus]